MTEKKCNGAVEVFSRVTGFFAVVTGFNKGKKEEYKDRKKYNINTVKEKNDKPKSE